MFGQFIKKANGKSKLFDKQNFGFPLELVFDNKWTFTFFNFV